MHATDTRLKFLGFRPTGDLADLTCYTTRRRRTVWFLKSPPLKPASDLQHRQRLRFTTAALAWRGLTQGTRNAWNQACRTAGLRIHGYNLWVHWQLIRNVATIRTVEHQSACTLLPF